MDVFTQSESALEHIFNTAVFKPATVLLPRDFANLCLPASPSEDDGRRKKRGISTFQFYWLSCDGQEGDWGDLIF